MKTKPKPLHCTDCNDILGKVRGDHPGTEILLHCKKCNKEITFITKSILVVVAKPLLSLLIIAILGFSLFNLIFTNQILTQNEEIQ